MPPLPTLLSFLFSFKFYFFFDLSCIPASVFSLEFRLESPSLLCVCVFGWPCSFICVCVSLIDLFLYSISLCRSPFVLFLSSPLPPAVPLSWLETSLITHRKRARSERALFALDLDGWLYGRMDGWIDGADEREKN